MAEKDIARYLMDDDYLFILLKIIDYPKCKREFFDFSDFSSLNYKKLNKSELLLLFFYLRDIYGMNIVNLNLDENKNKHFWSLVKKHDTFSAKKIFKKHNEAELEFFLSDVNFRMIVSTEMKKYVRESIEGHIKKLEQNKLAPIEEGLFLFEKQKKLFFQLIKNKYKNEGSLTIMNDNEIPEKCRFFEMLLLLDTKEYIKINKIINSESPKVFYRVLFEIKNKLLKKQSEPKKEAKKKNRSTPTCYQKDNLGYLKIKSSSNGKLIGPVTSRHFMLLNFLTKQGLDKNITFERAYDAIKDGKHQNRTNYNNEDEIENALGNAKKRLQKDRLIKPLIIIIDKEKRRISLMFNSRR